MCLRMEDMMLWANKGEFESILRTISNSVNTPSVNEVVAEKLGNEIEFVFFDESASLDESDEFGDEFASLDEPGEENEILETEEDEEDEEDEILEDGDDDPPEAALPSSLTDLLKVANTNRILEAA